jgi:LPPG:FO 2-phospho-L-lactate transferase
VTKVAGPVVLLAGGVGGARLGHGLQAHLGEDLVIVVNTGDDLERHGLVIWPDHDTVLYTLAGLDDRDRGWGLRDETWATMEALERLGESTWFRLGDRDLATHLVRTELLRAGRRPTEVALDLRRRTEVAARILPMTDDPVRTTVRTDDGWLPFQDYFVRLAQAPEVREVRLDGIATARATPEVLEALAAARAILVAPSNPFVSIGPILAVPGLRAAVDDARGRGIPVVGVSPIVGGRAIKGPADRMLVSLGGEASALGVARHHRDLLTGFVVDEVDAEAAPAIEALGVRVTVTDSIMRDDGARGRLAAVVLDHADRLRGTDRSTAPAQG